MHTLSRAARVRLGGTVHVAAQRITLARRQQAEQAQKHLRELREQAQQPDQSLWRTD